MATKSLFGVLGDSATSPIASVSTSTRFVAGNSSSDQGHATGTQLTAYLGTLYATLTQGNNADSHASNTSNPHSVTAAQAGAVPTARTVTAGTGLSGGGALSGNITLNIADTAVTPGSYTAADLTVDQQGRITAVANGTIALGSEVSGDLPLANFVQASGAKKILGRGDSGAGDFQELTLGSNIDITGTTINVSSGTATLGDGDYGDVVVSSTGTVMTIDADVVDNTKASNMAEATIKGRQAGSGTGNPEDLTATQVRTIINVADGATANAGTVTSVATGTGLTGGPITSTGTVSIADTAVTPGAYTNADITVDQQGRITAAANGTAGTGDVSVSGTPSAEQMAVWASGSAIKGVAGTRGGIWTINASNAVAFVAAGSEGDVLQIDASGDIVMGAQTVSSVFTRSGAITAQSGDYNATQITISAITPANYTPSAAQVEGHLDGIDTALGSVLTTAAVTYENLDANGDVGTGAAQVCAGNDSRLSDARTPTSHASSHQHSGGDEIATATPGANAIPKADGSSKLDGWISAASDTVAGKVELATTAETQTGTDTARAVTPAAGAATYLALAGGTMTGAINGGGQTLSSTKSSVMTSVSGSLTTASHSGNVLVTSGNVTVPNAAGDVGFNAVIIAGGAHTVTFNSLTSAAMASGDVMTVYVQSTTVIKAVLTAAADLVAFS